MDLLWRYSNPDNLALYRRILAGQGRDRPSRRPVPSVRQKQVRLAPDQIFDLIQDYLEGLTINQLAAKYDISRTTVNEHVKREGVPTRKNKLAGKLEEIKELRAAGQSYAKIGKKYEVTAQTVRRTLLNQSL